MGVMTYELSRMSSSLPLLTWNLSSFDLFHQNLSMISSEYLPLNLSSLDMFRINANIEESFNPTSTSMQKGWTLMTESATIEDKYQIN